MPDNGRSGDRPGRLSGRRVRWVLAALAAVWLVAGLRPLQPELEVGVLHSPWVSSIAFEVEGPMVLAPPGLLSLTRYPRHPLQLPLSPAERLMLPAPDGSRFGFRGMATLQVNHPLRVQQKTSGSPLTEVLADALAEVGGELNRDGGVRRATAALAHGLETGLDSRLEALGIELTGFALRGLDFLEVADDADVPLRPETRVLVIGLDGADWEILDPLIESGRVPNLARLVENGTRAKLLSINPLLSPVIWTSIATGVEPGRHGVHDFLVDDGQGGAAQPVTAAQRKAAAVWEMLSRAGATVGVNAWWATWPAEPVNGYMVSDRIAYQLFGYEADPEDALGKTWPPELYSDVLKMQVDPEQVDWEQVRHYLDGPRTRREQFPVEEQEMLDDLRTLIASGETYLRTAQAFHEEFEPQLELVYFEGTDTIGHLFMPYRPPRRPGVDAERFASFNAMVDRYYETADAYVGKLLEGRGDDWTVILISDHGFASDATRPRLTDPRIGHGPAADWHRRFGTLILSGAHVRSGHRLGEASIYDIAPTLLALFGHPVPRSWPGRVLGEALDPSFFEAHPVRFRQVDPPRELMAGQIDDPAAGDLMAKLQGLGYIGADAGSEGGGSRNNEGVALMGEGRYADAEALFREDLKGSPDNPSLLVNLALALRYQGKGEQAEPFLEQAFQYTTSRRSAGHVLAELAIERGALERAETYLRQVLEVEPEAAAVRTTLGTVLDSRGRPDEARREFEEAARLDPDSAKPRNHLGAIARERGDDASAERWFLEAIEADPYYVGAYNNLALVYQDRGELDRAIDLYSRALGKVPNNAVVLNNLASLRYARGESERAAELWIRAIQADPGYASPLNNLAGVRISEKNYRDAEQLLARALEVDPDYGDARMNLALIHWNRGDWASAREALRQAIEDPRARPRALFQAGMLELEQGNFEAGVEHLVAARQAGVGGPQLLNPLGEAYRRLGRETEARAAWEESLRIDPGQQGLREYLDGAR